MAIINSLKIAYSTAIHRHGTKKYPDIFPQYVEPVTEYAAVTYTDAELSRALANEWITKEEYDAIIALRPVEEIEVP